MDVATNYTAPAGSLPEPASWPISLGGNSFRGPRRFRKPLAESSPPPYHAAPSGRSPASRGFYPLQTRQRLGISAAQVQEQERPSADMLLSDLYRWQRAWTCLPRNCCTSPKPAFPARAIPQPVIAGDEDRAVDPSGRPAGVDPTSGRDVGRPTRGDHAGTQGHVAWPALGVDRFDTIEPLDWHLVFERRW